MTHYNFKVASIMTVSLKHILNLFRNNIIEVEANASITNDKPVKFAPTLKDKFGADFFTKENNFLFMKYNNKIHDNLNSSNIKRILKTMDELKIEDAAIQRLVVGIKDKKLGKICREVLSEVTEFIEKPVFGVQIPLIQRIPKNEDIFYLTFFADPIEKKIVDNYEEYLNGEIEKPEVEIYKPKSLKYFSLNLKKLINGWQTKKLPIKWNRNLPQLPPRLNIIDIENWNWKANFLPESYLSSAPVIDYIKDKYLGEYRCEKTFGLAGDNRVILNKFGR